MPDIVVAFLQQSLKSKFKTQNLNFKRWFYYMISLLACFSQWGHWGYWWATDICSSILPWFSESKLLNLHSVSLAFIWIFVEFSCLHGVLQTAESHGFDSLYFTIIDYKAIAQWGELVLGREIHRSMRTVYKGVFLESIAELGVLSGWEPQFLDPP